MIPPPRRGRLTPAPAVVNYESHLCGSGGIGRHARLRALCPIRVWGFESPLPHCPATGYAGLTSPALRLWSTTTSKQQHPRTPGFSSAVSIPLPPPSAFELARRSPQGEGGSPLPHKSPREYAGLTSPALRLWSTTTSKQQHPRTPGFSSAVSIPLPPPSAFELARHSLGEGGTNSRGRQSSFLTLADG
jgi:hypothetical protein